MTTSNDAVTNPSHYNLFNDRQAIQVIAASLTLEEFQGYCFGNLLKYRLRLGKKDNLEQDLAKSDFYVDLFKQYKHLCRAELTVGSITNDRC